MSFFGRAANLVKGGIKSLGKPGVPDDRERALDEELAGRAAPVPRSVTPAPPPAAKGAPTPEAKRPPERDEHGNVKRTL
jgi:hypothetical protein